MKKSRRYTGYSGRYRYSKLKRETIKIRTKNIFKTLLFKLSFFKQRIKNQTSYFYKKEREFSKEFGSLEKSITYDLSNDNERVELTYCETCETNRKPIFKIYDNEDEEYLGFLDDD